MATSATENPPRPQRLAGVWVFTATLIVLLLLLLSRTAYEPPLDQVIDFDQYHYGVVPQELDYDATGPHGPVLTAGRPYWRVFVDLFAPSRPFVLIQASALAEPDHYPIAWLRDVRAINPTLWVQIKPSGGELSQRAGLIWRVQDKDNYYAALVDPRNDRLYVVRMNHGVPAELASAPAAVDVEFERREPSPTRGWYLLQVEARGNRIAVWFQGEKVVEVSDGAIAQAGQVGVVTHADSIAAFDDFHVRIGRVERTATPRPTFDPAAFPTKMPTPTPLITEAPGSAPETQVPSRRVP